MTITFQNQELQQCLSTYTQRTNPALLANPKDRTLMLPNQLGTGYKRDIALEHGLSLTLHRYQYNEDVVFHHPGVQRNCVEFSFVMAANVRGTRLGRHNENVLVTGQQAYLLNSALPAHQCVEYAEQNFWAVDIHIETPFLTAMVMEHEHRLPLDFCRMVTGDDDRPLLDPVDITPTMQGLLQQIWLCPHTGLTRSLYLEAKSLELIALYIQAIQQKEESPSCLKSSDVEGIRQAQGILQRNLQSPPSLVELARQVGLNDRKLKQGFREVLNTTVFGYLTQQRMEAACRLLRQECSVAAVAALVGYASPTAFSGAFRRTFGVTPKAYQLANCRRA